MSEALKTCQMKPTKVRAHEGRTDMNLPPKVEFAVQSTGKYGAIGTLPPQASSSPGAATPSLATPYPTVPSSVSSGAATSNLATLYSPFPGMALIPGSRPAQSMDLFADSKVSIGATVGAAFPDGAPASIPGADKCNGSLKASKSSNINNSKYKTELCRSWTETGHCKYDEKCQFAHGQSDLRSVRRHPKYKTELCRSFHATNLCPYGVRCMFIHNVEKDKEKLISMNQQKQQQAAVEAEQRLRQQQAQHAKSQGRRYYKAN